MELREQPVRRKPRESDSEMAENVWRRTDCPFECEFFPALSSFEPPDHRSLLRDGDLKFVLLSTTEAAGTKPNEISRSKRKALIGDSELNMRGSVDNCGKLVEGQV